MQTNLKKHDKRTFQPNLAYGCSLMTF